MKMRGNNEENVVCLKVLIHAAPQAGRQRKWPFQSQLLPATPLCVSEQFLVMLVRCVAWFGERITGLRNRMLGFRPVSLTNYSSWNWGGGGVEGEWP